jgi:hypothetical protein
MNAFAAGKDIDSLRLYVPYSQTFDSLHASHKSLDQPGKATPNQRQQLSSLRQRLTKAPCWRFHRSAATRRSWSFFRHRRKSLCAFWPLAPGKRLGAPSHGQPTSLW